MPIATAKGTASSLPPRQARLPRHQPASMPPFKCIGDGEPAYQEPPSQRRGHQKSMDRPASVQKRHTTVDLVMPVSAHMAPASPAMFGAFAAPQQEVIATGTGADFDPQQDDVAAAAISQCGRRIEPSHTNERHRAEAA